MVFPQALAGDAKSLSPSVAPRTVERRSMAPVRVWLWIVALSIFAMVIVGGATRLTQSGLAITEWKPVMGVVPPLTTEAWQAEFEKYKAIPQYAELFPDMELAGFKSIFYWEWGHRLLGRVIGLLFFAPLVGFWLSGRLTPSLKPRLVGLLALGGLQGVIGWWMVKSGLAARVDVSQYRLAIHLVTASVTFAWAIWLAEGLRPVRGAIAEPQRPLVRAIATLLVGTVFLQLFLGALVAGLHAGLIYNTWPLMDGHLVPPLETLSQATPLWRNLFENVTTVQFDHRMLAYGVLVLSLVHALDAWRSQPGSATAGRAMVLAGLVLCQAALGVTTLLLVVPLSAALLHQAFAVVVLGTAILHRKRMSAVSAYPLAAARA